MVSSTRRALLTLCLTLAAPLAMGQGSAYFPPAGNWARKAPAELGLDDAKLGAALAYAQSRETERARDFSDQEKTFGALLGSVPTGRALTNGLVIYKGYVVAEFGDTTAVDPTYSVAKSMLASVAGVALRDGRIASLEQPVAKLVADGGYQSPQNAAVTWQSHLQQQSEWEGEMWGKRHDFVGATAFGAGERKPRALQKPGSFYEYNDVRINRLALSLLRVMDKPVPDVFRDEIMGPIGASSSWKWLPYHNSYVDLNGRRAASVSGGTRWGGGMWINSWDMARFGYLWLRGGAWNGRQLLPAGFVRDSLAPSAHGPDNGYLWWLNTRGKNLPGLPSNAFAALGAGSNTIVVSPDHELVIVWRWHAGSAADFARRVIESIPAPR